MLTECVVLIADIFCHVSLILRLCLKSFTHPEGALKGNIEVEN
jgi:hypothetical protein